MNYLQIAKWAGGLLVAAALVFCFIMWQNAREEVGELKTKLDYQTTYSAGLKNQLAEANTKINSTAKAGAVSYGHCQDLVANDAGRNFDLGVTFGRASCPVISSSAVPLSPSQAAAASVPR